MAFSARHVYYDGKVQKSHGDSFQTIDPSTGDSLAEIHSATPADVDSAIECASKAFASWSSQSAISRSRILLRANHLLRERNDEIAKLETADTGKPFSETSTVDVVFGADVLEYFAGTVAGGGLNGETTQLREDAWIYTKKEPIGVCAGIGAWNYPIQMYVLAGFDFGLHLTPFQSAVEVSTMSSGRQHHGVQTERGYSAACSGTGGDLY